MSPYTLPDGNVQIAFSGGRTSAYMLHQILEANGSLPERTDDAGGERMSKLPRSRIIKIEFEIALPMSATREEIDDWVAYCLGSGSCGPELAGYELDPIDPPVLTDMEVHLDRQVVDMQSAGRSTTYSVRTARTLGPIPPDQPLDPVTAMLRKSREGV